MRSNRKHEAYTNQLGQVTRTDYDVAGRSTTVTNANLEVVSFAYNAAGDRRTLADGKSQVTSWGYDSFGRVTSETNAASAEVFRFQYDANNRLTNRWSAAKGARFTRTTPTAIARSSTIPPAPISRSVLTL